jgi:thioredoxin reductase
VWFGRERVTRIRFVTNKDRTLIIGNGRTEDVVYNTTNEDSKNENEDHYFIAFYGRTSDEMVHQLGVVSMRNYNKA